MRTFHWLGCIILLALLASGCSSTVTTASPVAPKSPVSTQVGGSDPCEITAEEYAVYSAIIRSKFEPAHRSALSRALFNPSNPEVIVIYNQTFVGPLVWSDFVEENASEQAKELLADLAHKTTQPCTLGNQFDAGVPVVLISKVELNRIFAEDHDGWQVFYEQFPYAQGVMNITRVGFDKTGTIAVVNVDNQQHYLAGTGYNYLLEKRDGVWVIIAEFMWRIS